MKTQLILDVVVAGFGFANLVFYAWGAHDPANLAVGIFCLFVAQWRPGR